MDLGVGRRRRSESRIDPAVGYGTDTICNAVQRLTDAGGVKAFAGGSSCGSTGCVCHYLTRLFDSLGRGFRGFTLQFVAACAEEPVLEPRTPEWTRR